MLPRLALCALFVASLCLLGLSVPRDAEAGGEGWSHDVAASLAKAAAEKKDVLMDFTGSDWCGWCIKLVKEVFSQEGFYEAASKDFVLVELDFPRQKELAPEVKQQNNEWKNKLGVSGYPTIMLTDATGKPYAQTGYRPGGKDVYLKHLAELRAIRVERDEALTKAAALTGVEKAKQLDAALSKIPAQLVALTYGDIAKQIVALDPENQAGLASKYKGKLAVAAARALMGTRDFKGAIAKVDEMLQELGATGQVAQDLYLIRSEANFYNRDRDTARKDLDAALKAAPEGDKVKTIKGIISRVFKEK